MKLYVWDANVDDGTHDQNGSVVLLAKDDAEALRLFREAFPYDGFYKTQMNSRTVHEKEFAEPHDIYELDEARVVLYAQGGDT